jgi:hypothetical protein
MLEKLEYLLSSLKERQLLAMATIGKDFNIVLVLEGIHLPHTQKSRLLRKLDIGQEEQIFWFSDVEKIKHLACQNPVVNVNSKLEKLVLVL